MTAPISYDEGKARVRVGGHNDKVREDRIDGEAGGGESKVRGLGFALGNKFLGFALGNKFLGFALGNIDSLGLPIGFYLGSPLGAS